MRAFYTVTATLVVEVEDLGASQQVAQDAEAVAAAVGRHLRSALPGGFTIGGYRFLTDQITTIGQPR